MKKVAKILAGTIVLSLVACSEGNKTSGVTEEDNAVAHNESSSSVVQSSSSVEQGFSSSAAVVVPDLWNGANWFSFADRERGGMSRVQYPVNVGYESGMEELVAYCGGICATSTAPTCAAF